MLVVVGSFPTFGETRVDDRVSGGSAWRGYSGAVGDEATSYSAPGQGVTLLLAAVVLLAGAGLLLAAAARSTGAALAVSAPASTLAVVIWRFLVQLALANSIEAASRCGGDVTLGLGGWLLAVAGLGAAGTAGLGIAAVRRARGTCVA